MTTRPYSVAVIVRCTDGRLIFQYRNGGARANRFRIGCFGGQVDPADADPIDTGVRELREETELEVAREEIEILGEYDDAGRGGYRYVLLLRRQVDVHALRIHEGAGALAFTREEIRELREEWNHLATWLPDCFDRFDLWSLWP